MGWRDCISRALYWPYCRYCWQGLNPIWCFLYSRFQHFIISLHWIWCVNAVWSSGLAVWRFKLFCRPRIFGCLEWQSLHNSICMSFLSTHWHTLLVILQVFYSKVPRFINCFHDLWVLYSYFTNPIWFFRSQLFMHIATYPLCYKLDEDFDISVLVLNYIIFISGTWKVSHFINLLAWFLSFVLDRNEVPLVGIICVLLLP